MIPRVIRKPMNRGNYELTAFLLSCQSHRLYLAEDVAGMVNITYDKSQNS